MQITSVPQEVNLAIKQTTCIAYAILGDWGYFLILEAENLVLKNTSQRHFFPFLFSNLGCSKNEKRKELINPPVNILRFHFGIYAGNYRSTHCNLLKKTIVSVDFFSI